MTTCHDAGNRIVMYAVCMTCTLTGRDGTNYNSKSCVCVKGLPSPTRGAA